MLTRFLSSTASVAVLSALAGGSVGCTLIHEEKEHVDLRRPIDPATLQSAIARVPSVKFVGVRPPETRHIFFVIPVTGPAWYGFKRHNIEGGVEYRPGDSGLTLHAGDFENRWSDDVRRDAREVIDLVAASLKRAADE